MSENVDMVFEYPLPLSSPVSFIQPDNTLFSPYLQEEGASITGLLDGLHHNLLAPVLCDERKETLICQYNRQKKVVDKHFLCTSSS